MKFLCAVLFIFLCSAPANATIFCEVLKTPDGFVALREAPSAGSKLLLRIKTGEQVQVDFTKKGTWEKVIYYLSTGKPANAKPITGWVKSKYLSDVCG
jgi:hypothetical protein